MRGEEAGLTARALRQVSLCEELRDNRVERWLDRATSLEEFSIYDDIKEPEVYNDIKEPEGGQCSFNIWAEPGYGAADPWKEGDRVSSLRALRDVTGQLPRRRVFKEISKLQKPGYLGKTSTPPQILWLLETSLTYPSQ